jgi:dipeptidase E
MKLYLTSYRIPVPDKLFELAGKTPPEIRTAVIPNAKDYYSERARAVKLREITEYLAGLSLKSDMVDLREHQDADVLKKLLSGYDLLWVSGGNTFCLRDEMQKSGFDKIINELLDQGLVYAGESAGACVAGKSLKGLESADNPEFTESIIWSGLGLVPNFILPHTDTPLFAADTQVARELHKDDPTLLELRDSQALIIDGHKREVVAAP